MKDGSGDAYINAPGAHGQGVWGNSCTDWLPGLAGSCASRGAGRSPVLETIRRVDDPSVL